MLSCPACKRPNAPQRTTCLYCGGVLPGGGAPVVNKPNLPANLDELVNAALRKGEIGKLKAAIEESRREAAEASSSGTPDGAPSGTPDGAPTGTPDGAPTGTPDGAPSGTPDGAPSGTPDGAPSGTPDGAPSVAPDGASGEARPAPPRPGTAPPAPPAPAPPPPRVDPGPLLRELAERAASAELRWRQGLGIDGELDQLAALLARARAALPAAPAAPVILPPIRQSWALALEGPPDPGPAPALAEALELDLPTAKMLCMGRAVRVGRRAARREDLERFVPRLRERVGLRAVLVSREDLLGIAPPRVALRLGADRWELAEGPLWELDPERLAALSGVVEAPGEVRAVIPGEVVTRRYRAATGARGSKELKPELVGERRVGVVDLHGPGLFVRLVEGASDPSPELPPGPILPRFRAFIEALPVRFPGAHLEPRRVCRPMDTPTLREGAERNEGVEVSGWPAFEEHTRLCRVVLLGRDG